MKTGLETGLLERERKDEEREGVLEGKNQEPRTKGARQQYSCTSKKEVGEKRTMQQLVRRIDGVGMSPTFITS